MCQLKFVITNRWDIKRAGECIYANGRWFYELSTQSLTGLHWNPVVDENYPSKDFKEEERRLNGGLFANVPTETHVDLQACIDGILLNMKDNSALGSEYDEFRLSIKQSCKSVIVAQR